MTGVRDCRCEIGTYFGRRNFLRTEFHIRCGAPDKMNLEARDECLV